VTPYSETIFHGPRFITLSQFCKRYQVSRSTVYRLAHGGAFTIVKFGRSSRIALNDAESWAAALPIMGGGK